MRLVVSFTTTPSRIELLGAMVSSVLGQTRRPDRFMLALPDRCERQGQEYVIPDWLETHVEVFRCGRDLGPATKLIPALRDEDAPDTAIVTLDDDMAYEKHTLEELCGWSERLPDCALGMMGVTFCKQFAHAEELRDHGIKCLEVRC